MWSIKFGAFAFCEAADGANFSWVEEPLAIGAYHIYQPEAAFTGGIAATWEIIRKIEAAGAQYSPTPAEPAPGEFAIQAAIGNSDNQRQCFSH